MPDPFASIAKQPKKDPFAGLLSERSTSPSRLGMSTKQAFKPEADISNQRNGKTKPVSVPIGDPFAKPKLQEQPYQNTAVIHSARPAATFRDFGDRPIAEIAMDTLGFYPRFANAVLGSVLRPDSAGFKRRLNTQGANMGALIDELTPYSDPIQRKMNHGLGLVGDVGFDPMTWLFPGAGLAAAEMKASERLLPRVIGTAMTPLSSTGEAALNAAGRGVFGRPVQNLAVGQVIRRGQKIMMQKAMDEDAIKAGLSAIDATAQQKAVQGTAASESERILGNRPFGGISHKHDTVEKQFDEAVGKVFDTQIDAYAGATGRARAKAAEAAKAQARKARGMGQQARTLNAKATAFGQTAENAKGQAGTVLERAANAETAVTTLEAQREAAHEAMMGFTPASHGVATGKSTATGNAFQTAVGQHKDVIDKYLSKMDDVSNIERDIQDMKGGTSGSMLRNAPDNITPAPQVEPPVVAAGAVTPEESPIPIVRQTHKPNAKTVRKDFLQKAWGSTEKLDPETGLSDTQSRLLRERLTDVAHDNTLLAEHNLSGTQQYLAPVDIALPGDGTFTVRSPKEANALHQAVSKGEPIVGFSRQKGIPSRVSTPKQKPTFTPDSYLEQAITAYGDPDKAAAHLESYLDAWKKSGGKLNPDVDVAKLQDAAAKLRSIANGDTFVPSFDFLSSHKDNLSFSHNDTVGYGMSRSDRRNYKWNSSKAGVEATTDAAIAHPSVAPPTAPVEPIAPLKAVAPQDARPQGFPMGKAEAPTGVPFGIGQGTGTNPASGSLLGRKALAQAKEEAARLKAQVDQAGKSLRATWGAKKDMPPDVKAAFSAYDKATKGLIKERENVRGLMRESSRMERFGKVAENRAALRTTKAENLKGQVASIRQALINPQAKAATRDAIHVEGQTAAGAARTQALSDMANEGFDPKASEALVDRLAQYGDVQGVHGYLSGVFKKGQVVSNQGHYLTRIYEKHLDPETYAHMLQSDPGALMRYLSEQDAGRIRGGSNAMSAVKSRKDLDEATRQGLGQYTRASERVKFGGTLTGKRIARRETLANIAANFAVDDGTANALNVAARASGISAQNYKQMLGGKWGPLKDMWVPDEVHKILLREFDSPAPNMDALSRAYRRLIGAWKYGKVILSPAARSRNIVSNGWRAYTSEGMRPAEFTVYNAKALKALREDAPIVREALESNPTFHQTWVKQELNFADKPGTQKFWKSLAERPANGYERDEMMGKLAIFMWKRDHGATAREAGAAAERALFTYAKAHPSVKASVRSGFTPFLTYSGLAIPAELKSLKQHPERYANIIKAIREVEGIDPQNAETGNRERQTMPEWMRSSVMARLPFVKNEGSPSYLDATYWLPFGQVIGDNPVNQAAQMLNPALKGAAELIFNQKLGTGQRVVTPGAAMPDQLKEVGQYLWDVAAPPLAGYGGRAIADAATGVKGKSGKDMPMLPAVLANIAGIKTRPVNTKANATGLALSLRSAQGERNTAFRKNDRDFRQGRITRAERDQKNRQADEKLTALGKDTARRISTPIGEGAR